MFCFTDHDAFHLRNCGLDPDRCREHMGIPDPPLLELCGKAARSGLWGLKCENPGAIFEPCTCTSESLLGKVDGAFFSGSCKCRAAHLHLASCPRGGRVGGPSGQVGKPTKQFLFEKSETFDNVSFPLIGRCDRDMERWLKAEVLDVCFTKCLLH